MNRLLPITAIFVLMTCLASCSVVGGIFKAGVWVGVLVVVLVIGLILFLISRGTKK